MSSENFVTHFGDFVAAILGDVTAGIETSRKAKGFVLFVVFVAVFVAGYLLPFFVFINAAIVDGLAFGFICAVVATWVAYAVLARGH